MIIATPAATSRPSYVEPTTQHIMRCAAPLMEQVAHCDAFESGRASLQAPEISSC